MAIRTFRGPDRPNVRKHALRKVAEVHLPVSCCRVPGDPIILSVAHQEMKNIYKYILIASIALALCIYGLFFNRLSETAMVRWSYLWLPGVLFSAVGLKSGQASPRLPLIVAAIGVVALFLFFELIFPSL